MAIDELVNFFRRTFKLKVNEKDICFHLLLSNSSRALERHVSESSTVPPLLYINVVPNKSNNTLTITDNGVGMTHADVLSLADLASSRAKVFMQAVAACFALNPIALYGFGFYFAFLVADKVEFRTKHYDDEEYGLDLDLQAGGSPTVTSDARGLHRPSGSMMRLYLKEDQLEYLEVQRLRDLIKKYSEKPISHQINLSPRLRNLIKRYSKKPISHKINLLVRRLCQIDLPASHNRNEVSFMMTKLALETFCVPS